MKKYLLSLVLAFLMFTGHAQTKQETKNCATDDLHLQQMKSDPAYKKRFEENNALWQQWAPDHLDRNRKDSSTKRNVPLTQNVTLSVIIHDMMGGTASLPTNQDYIINGLNDVFDGFSGPFSSPDTKIRFCLAQRKANGDSFTTIQHPTLLTVVDRTIATDISTIVNNSGSQLGSGTAFPSSKYINIYVVDDIAGSTAGFATLPSAHGATTDGIFIKRSFLLNNAQFTENIKVLVHEMGHYLGLLHTFGICDPSIIATFPACSCDNGNCLYNGDMICDTPPNQLMTSGYTCFPDTPIPNTCSTDAIPYFINSVNMNPFSTDQTDPIHNFMNYSPYTCTSQFTNDQVTRMQFMIDPVVGVRKSLLGVSQCVNCTALNSCTFGISTVPGNSIVQSIPTTIPATTFSVTTAGCVVPSITYNWSLTAAGSTTVLFSGTGNSFTIASSATVSAGNYVLTLNAVLAADSNCFETATYSFQVVPAAGACTFEVPSSAGNWGTAGRAKIVNGWPRNDSSPYSYTFSNTRTVLSSTATDDGFGINDYSTDANFTGIAAPAGLNVMRVGPKLNTAAIVPAGNAYYVTLKFHPTRQNCKFRVHYIGMLESTVNPTNIAYDNYNLHTNAGSDAAFGYLSQYKYHSPVSTSGPTQMSRVGMSEDGILVDNGSGLNIGSTTYGLNDMVSGKFNSSPADYTAVSGTTYSKMGAWKFCDLDFSEFVDLDTPGNPAMDTEITVTFFAHSNDALNALKSAYGYFAVECKGGGVPAPFALNYPDVSLNCNQDQYNVPWFLPNYLLIHTLAGVQNILTNSINNLGLVTVKKFNTATNAFDIPASNANIVTGPTDVPFSTYQVTYETLHGTYTDTFNIFKSFVSTYSCVIGAREPATLANYVVCDTDSFSLPLLDYTASDCVSDKKYKWHTNADYNVTLATTEDYQVTAADLLPGCLTAFIREVDYTDIYCGNTIQRYSQPVNIYNLGGYQFSYAAQDNDICLGGNYNVDVTNFKISNAQCILNTLVNTLPSAHSISVQLCKTTTVGGPVTLLGNPYLMNFNSTGGNLPVGAFPDFSLGFVNFDSSAGVPYFIPTTTSNEFSVGLQVTYTIFGCTKTIIIYDFQKFNIKPSAFAGQIVRDGSCSPVNIINAGGITPITFPAGNYSWQYSYDNGVTYTNMTSGPTTETFPNVLPSFTTFPVLVRRVAYGTGTCSAPSYSNPVEINSTSTVTPTFSLPSVVCKGGVAPALETTSLNGITGSWNYFGVSNTVSHTYIFTPDPGQCASVYSIAITVMPTAPPTFLMLTNYCANNLPVALPLTSLEGVTGYWTPSNFITGSGAYTFHPTSGGGCRHDATMVFTVQSGTMPVFTGLQTTYCVGATVTLPAISSNGVAGTWSTLDTSTPGTVNASFTPLAGGICYKYKGTFTILPNNVVPVFNFVTNICSGGTAPVLPLTSTNGITGTWTPAIVSNTAGATYTFHPAAGQCAVDATVPVTISQNCGVSLYYIGYLYCEQVTSTDIRKEYFVDLEGGDCLIACQGKPVAYTLVGGTSNIASTVWNVTGGVKSGVSNTGVTIRWTATDYAYLNGIITFTDGSTLTINKCVEVIASPQADFTTMPDPGRKDLTGCQNTPIYFENLTQIGGGNGNFYYQWSFDDGTFSNEFEPVHTFTDEREYTVTLTVTNSCGCSTTITRTITIRDKEIAITCNSVACEGDISEYSISPDYQRCEGTVWSVIGGTIVDQSAGNTIIHVRWDNVDADGFGYVTVHSESHCFCSTGGTIKVPVVKHIGTIVGPSRLCPNDQSIYSLPQWPTTDFIYTLVDDTSGATLFHTNERNEIVVQPTHSGHVTLHCEYTNTLLKCGGTADFQIQVDGSPQLTGDLEVCTNTAANLYTVDDVGDPMGGVTFTIRGPSGSTSGVSDSSGYFTKTFTTAGEYVFTATGSAFCTAAPFTIHVTTKPTAPTAISGTLSDVCPGIVYTYTIPAVPGMVANWQVTGGTPTGGVTGNSFSVVFSSTATAPYTLQAWYTNESCESPKFSASVTPRNPSIPITGTATVNGSCTSHYTVPNVGAESYIWTLDDPTKGSIVNGQNSTDITVMWNEGPSTVHISCTVMICSRPLTQAPYTVTVLPSTVAQFVSPVTSTCSGVSNTYTVSQGTSTISSVDWDFGDGTVLNGQPGASMAHSFESPITGLASYTVSAVVHYLGNGGCQLRSVTHVAVSVSPMPVVDIFPKYISLCPANPTPTGGVITLNIQAGFASTSTVNFYKLPDTVNPVAVSTPGTTGIAAMTATSSGTYYAVVTNSLVCSKQSDYVTVSDACGTITTGPGTGTGTAACTATEATTVSISQSCGNVTATAMSEGTPIQVVWAIPGAAYTTNVANSSNFSASGLKPGFYQLLTTVFYTSGGVTCSKQISTDFTVDVNTALRYSASCGTGNYNVDLLDFSVYASGASLGARSFSVDGGPWQVGSPGVGNAHHLVVPMAPGIHTARIQVAVAGGFCVSEPITIDLPAMPVANFTYTPSVCNGEFVQFNVVNPQPGDSYSWSFSDGSINTAMNVQKQFFAAGSAVLTVTNRLGCSATTTPASTVTVKPVNVHGKFVLSPAKQCVGGSIGISFTPDPGNIAPTTFHWFKAEPTTSLPATGSTLTVTQAGLYYAYVSTADGCTVYDTKAISVFFTDPPAVPTISGNANVCESEGFKVKVQASSDQRYQWYIDGSAYMWGNSFTQIEDLLSAGDHTIGVTASLIAAPYCTSAMATFVVHVIGTPDTPDVSMSNIQCGPYAVTLTVNNPQPDVVYHWSNGMTGTSIVAIHDGPIGVVADLGGCTSSWEGDLPVDIGQVWWVFPTGCYATCDKRKFEGEVVGPYGIFADWAYTPGISGSNTFVDTFSGFGNGSYSFTLSNGSCTVTRSAMDITIGGCEDCKAGVKDYRVERDREYRFGCRQIVTIALDNSTGHVEFFNMDCDPAVGYFMPSSIAALPGTNTYVVYFYPAPTFSGGTVATTFTGTSDREKSCTFDFGFRLPNCENNEKPVKSNNDTVDTKYNNSLILAPNPATFTTTVYYNINSDGGEKSLVVTDMLGRTLVSLPISSLKGETTLNLSGYTAGTYVVFLREDGKVLAQAKLLVNKD